MRILAIGDSLTEGVGDLEGGWALRLSRLPEITVTIKGIGGNTTRDLLLQIPSSLIERWEIAIVQVGLNDSRWRVSLDDNEIPLFEFITNLKKISHRLSAFADQVVFLGLTRVDETKTSPYKPDKYYENEKIAAYDAAIQETVEGIGAHFLRMPSLINQPGLLADGLHPSGRGYEKILSVVVSYIKNRDEHG